MDSARRKYLRLLAYERHVKRIFGDAIRAGANAVTERELARLIYQSVPLPAVKSAGHDAALPPLTIFQAASLMSRVYAKTLVDGLVGLIRHAAQAERERLPRLSKRLSKDDAEDAIDAGDESGSITVDWSTPNTAAVEAMVFSSLGRITEITAQQQEVILSVLRSGVERGINPVQMARELRNSIGLTDYQMGIVDRYRTALEAAGTGDYEAAANALGRALRDARFDNSVLRAVNTATPLTPEKINTMVERYQSRFLDYRAETISRTEAIRSVSEAENAVWQDAVNSGMISQDEIVQTWNTAGDGPVSAGGRTRDWHYDMEGQQVPFGQPFVSGLGNELMFPGDPSAPAEDVINCRCVVTREFAPSPNAEDATGEASQSAVEYVE